MLRDPLVPVDFGGWFRRVFGVWRRSFRPLAAMAVLTAGYFITLAVLRPTPEQLRQRLASAGAAAPDPAAVFAIVFWRLVPVMVVFLLLLIVVGAGYQGAAFYLAIRKANGQPATTAQALRFAGPRVPSLVGWGLLAGLIILVAVAVPLIPGFTLRVGALAGLGAVLGIALGVAGVAVFASLFGVVLVERGGPRRCLTLLSGRFWASLGRG